MLKSAMAAENKTEPEQPGEGTWDQGTDKAGTGRGAVVFAVAYNQQFHL